MCRLSAKFGKVLFLIALRGIIESWIIAFPISTAITIRFAVCRTRSEFCSICEKGRRRVAGTLPTIARSIWIQALL